MEKLKELCQMRMSKEDICILLEIDEETLHSYLRQKGYISFSELYEEQSEIMKQELMGLLAKAAESGNKSARAFLKNFKG